VLFSLAVAFSHPGVLLIGQKRLGRQEGVAKKYPPA
jgi:hypothetical protein